ncbi:UDP-N-acetylmuramate dehydrogenase [Eudoraea chungangensis]|uniref:UDP-N-acetylmuramate dehydrogenase n=1 Tax=Eudoraea chungangensis TaxID=1481905 RepID=UPI0023EDF353
MLKIEENISLKAYNTFGIEAKARYFVCVNTIEELIAVLELPNFPNKLVLGGGSNVLIVEDIDALVIRINLKGIQILKEDEHTVEIRAMAGENWHSFVEWAVNNNYGGLENLSLIPGNVGTAPIQNIGAYGVELKDLFISCQVIEISTQKLLSFSKQECQFGYRNSIFKTEQRGKYIILSVDFELSKIPHQLNTSYGAIESELLQRHTAQPTIQDVSQAVIKIRQSKLPDPANLGNSGSFFKNPEISKKAFEEFIEKNPKAPFYKISEDTYKIPAGWLIEQCGYKGKRYGDAGVHEKQALVLVNYGSASGMDILTLAKKIQASVQCKYGITIVPEVNIIGEIKK